MRLWADTNTVHGRNRREVRAQTHKFHSESTNAMAKSKKAKNRKDKLMDSGPVVTVFGNIDVLNEFYAENGWDAEYRQLEPGELHSQVSVREIGRVGVFREETSHKIACSARSPKDYFSIVLSLGEQDFFINGNRIGRDSLLLVPPGSNMDITAFGGADGITIHISPAMLSDNLRSIRADDSILEPEMMTLFHIDEDHIEPFSFLMDELASQPLPKNAYDTIASDLVKDLSFLLASPFVEAQSGDSYRQRMKRRVFARAKEFIHTHLAEHIRVTDLCAHCAVSLSTLERLFRREMDISPNEYILAVRLHEARRKLLNGYPKDATIAEIAMSCGFTHMGRFSGHYRIQFGHLPSQDRHGIANSS